MFMEMSVNINVVIVIIMFFVIEMMECVWMGVNRVIEEVIVNSVSVLNFFIDVLRMMDLI